MSWLTYAPYVTRTHTRARSRAHHERSRADRAEAVPLHADDVLRAQGHRGRPRPGLALVEDDPVAHAERRDAGPDVGDLREALVARDVHVLGVGPLGGEEAGGLGPVGVHALDDVDVCGVERGEDEADVDFPLARGGGRAGKDRTSRTSEGGPVWV